MVIPSAACRVSPRNLFFATLCVGVRSSSACQKSNMMYLEQPLAAAAKYRVKIVGTSISGALNREWTFTMK